MWCSPRTKIAVSCRRPARTMEMVRRFMRLSIKQTKWKIDKWPPLIRRNSRTLAWIRRRPMPRHPIRFMRPFDAHRQTIVRLPMQSIITAHRPLASATIPPVMTGSRAATLIQKIQRPMWRSLAARISPTRRHHRSMRKFGKVRRNQWTRRKCMLDSESSLFLF